MSMENDEDEEDDTLSYGDSHRAFLQALLSRQTLTYEEAKPLIARIQTAATPDRPTLEHDVTSADLEAYVIAVNAAVSPFDLEIRSTKHQVSNERVYALVNATSDALTQMATLHTPDEIAFVKRVLDAVFDTNNTREREVFAVTGMQALKLANPQRGERRESVNQTQGGQRQAAALTVSQAEKVLDNLEAAGWLAKSQKGFYSPTQRLLMELRHWLEQMYNDDDDDDDDDDADNGRPPHKKIKTCASCREIVTVGQRCPNLPCEARLHDHCARRKFQAQGVRRECPTCKTEWIDVPLVGEKAARNSGARSGNGAVSRRGTAVSGRTDDESSASAEAD